MSFLLVSASWWCVKCPNGSADWMIAVVTVGSKVGERGGAVYWGAHSSRSRRRRDHPIAVTPHSFKSTEGIVALWEMCYMTCPHFHFQGCVCGWGNIAAGGSGKKTIVLLMEKSEGRTGFRRAGGGSPVGALHDSPACMCASFLGPTW